MSHLDIIFKIPLDQERHVETYTFSDFLHQIWLGGTPVTYIENLYEEQPYKYVSIPIFMDIVFFSKYFCFNSIIYKDNTYSLSNIQII